MYKRNTRFFILLLFILICDTKLSNGINQEFYAKSSNILETLGNIRRYLLHKNVIKVTSAVNIPGKIVGTPKFRTLAVEYGKMSNTPFNYAYTAYNVGALYGDLGANLITNLVKATTADYTALEVADEDEDYDGSKTQVDKIYSKYRIPKLGMIVFGAYFAQALVNVLMMSLMVWDSLSEKSHINSKNEKLIYESFYQRSSQNKYENLQKKLKPFFEKEGEIYSLSMWTEFIHNQTHGKDAKDLKALILFNTLNMGGHFIKVKDMAMFSPSKSGSRNYEYFMSVFVKPFTNIEREKQCFKSNGIDYTTMEDHWDNMIGSFTLLLSSFSNYFTSRINKKIINNLLEESRNNLDKKAPVAFSNINQKKQSVRSIIVSRKKDREILINNLRIVKKQLREINDISEFPSTIILFVGGTGTGKTMAAEMTIYLIEQEMYLNLIKYKKASFTGSSPKLIKVDTNIGSAQRTVGAIEHAVKHCQIMYMEDFDQVVTSRTGAISLDKYIMMNYILRYFNVGKANAEQEVFHGINVATTSLPHKIDQAALRRIGTVILMEPEKSTNIMLMKIKFINEALLEGYEDDMIKSLLDLQHHMEYISILLEISKDISPAGMKTFVHSVLMRCAEYGYNWKMIHEEIESGKKSTYSPEVIEEIKKIPFLIDKNNFATIAEQAL